MASMDTWVNAMLKDMGEHNEDNKGGDKYELSENDVDRIAEKMIAKLSDDEMPDKKQKEADKKVSTSKQKDNEDIDNEEETE